jgi:hypothetical protein
MTAPSDQRSRAAVRPSIDFRTKSFADIEPFTVEDLHGAAGAELTSANGALAGKAQEQLGLPPLVLDVDGRTCTVDKGKISADLPSEDGLVVKVPATTLPLLRAGAVSLWMLTLTDLRTDWMKPTLAWDFALRTLFTGRPLHEAGLDGWSEPDGAGFGLDHAFTPDADDLDIGAFLVDAGFVRLRGWADPDLLPLIEREVLEAAAQAPRDNPDHLWAQMSDGTERCVRLRHAVRSSPTLAAFVASPAHERIGGLFADGHHPILDLPHGSEALIKPAGTIAKETDLPWHRDCTGIGCAFHCAAYIVGLPLTVTNAHTGMLRVVAGSHRASVPPPGISGSYDSGLPIIEIPTEPGDLTIHLSCTLHGTVPSTEVERTVVYINHALPAPAEPNALGL